MRQMNMTEGSLLDKILLFALPLAASSLLQLLFNAADVMVVGRFAGSTALAAVGCTTQVINLLVNLFVGLSVGANVLIANALGRRDHRELPFMVHTSVCLALISGILMLAVGQLLARPVLILVSTPAEVLELSVLYLRIYFLGMPFIMGYNFGAAILRSKGDTRRPLCFLIISGILNLLLNLLLVIVFRLSVAGVAIATVASNMVSFSLVFHCLSHEDGPLRFELRQLRLHPVYVRRILAVGIPAGVQSMVFSLSNLCIQSGINSFGADCVAGSAAANNFEGFCYTTINAFGQAAVTFTSQNYGAKQYGRCKRVALLTWLSSTVAAAVLDWSFYLGRGMLLRLYTTDPAVLAYGMQRMYGVLRLQFIVAGFEILAGSLRGIGHSTLPTCLGILGSCVLRLAWMYTVFARRHEFSVLLAAYPFSWTATILMMAAAWLIVALPALSRGDLPPPRRRREKQQ